MANLLTITFVLAAGVQSIAYSDSKCKLAKLIEFDNSVQTACESNFQAAYRTCDRKPVMEYNQEDFIVDGLKFWSQRTFQNVDDYTTKFWSFVSECYDTVLEVEDMPSGEASFYEPLNRAIGGNGVLRLFKVKAGKAGTPVKDKEKLVIALVSYAVFRDMYTYANYVFVIEDFHAATIGNFEIDFSLGKPLRAAFKYFTDIVGNYDPLKGMKSSTHVRRDPNDKSIREYETLSLNKASTYTYKIDLGMRIHQGHNHPSMRLTLSPKSAKANEIFSSTLWPAFCNFYNAYFQVYQSSMKARAADMTYSRCAGYKWLDISDSSSYVATVEFLDQLVV